MAGTAGRARYICKMHVDDATASRRGEDGTMHGVTKPTSWSVNATATPTGLTGTAMTKLRFSDFDLAAPPSPSWPASTPRSSWMLDFAFQRQDVNTP